MPKLNTLTNYYEPFVFIKRSQPNEKNLIINCLNQAYYRAIRNILIIPPASYLKSTLFKLCIDTILHGAVNLTEINLPWLEQQIQEDPILSTLDQNNPEAKKIELIKKVTELHQKNLGLLTHPTISQKIITAITRTLELENRLNSYWQKRQSVIKDGEIKEYHHDYFTFFQKSFCDKKRAITAFKKALEGEPTNLLPHLSTLCDSDLGEVIRDFVKSGLAEEILDTPLKHRTAHAFIKQLHKQVNVNLTAPSSNYMYLSIK
ncbi:Uncharacterised protein [Legionella beliardensis]|uniref:Uncharacterized protein n=1 Tax=Legionella beliardensis TaxID=91822 RepID=A0A378IBH9_9GAMM|nr:hypothetical protein [Legionella beliardensis]STX29654.1 Uncharacterised protein [Legionella beliardensis]